MWKFRLAELFVTFFYVGKIKYAPGTFGSFAAVLMIGLIGNLTTEEFYIFFTPYIILPFVIIYFISVYFIEIYSRYSGRQDAKEIVIDEVIGQSLAIILFLYSIVYIFHTPLESSTYFTIFAPISFVSFRFFDIVKPWFIGDIDKNIKNAHGVILDDLAAGLCSFFGIIVIIIALIFIYMVAFSLIAIWNI